MSVRFDHANFDDRHTLVMPSGDIDPLKRWGCLFVDQVNARSTGAGVVWLPELVADVAHLHAIQDSSAKDVEPFDFNRVAYRTVVFDASNGRQHLLFHDDVQSLQLYVNGDVRRPCHLVPDIVAGRKQTKHALKALHCFNELRVTGKLNAQYCIPAARAPRLRVVLQALDGALAGAKLLMMLDEFPALGRLDFFETALAFMAGYGIRYIDSGFGLLQGDVTGLTTVLIGIDITLAGLFWAMDGENNVLASLIKKVLYVGTFAYILSNFSTLATIIFNSFSTLGLTATNSGLTANDLLKPGKLAGTGFQAAWPLLQQAGTMAGFTTFFSNFVTIAVLMFAWAVVVLAFFILAVQLFITILEFKLTTLAGFVLVPFALWGKTAFLAERVLGNVIASGIKVTVIADSLI